MNQDWLNLSSDVLFLCLSLCGNVQCCCNGWSKSFLCTSVWVSTFDMSWLMCVCRVDLWPQGSYDRRVWALSETTCVAGTGPAACKDTFGKNKTSAVKTKVLCTVALLCFLIQANMFNPREYIDESLKDFVSLFPLWRTCCNSMIVNLEVCHIFSIFQQWRGAPCQSFMSALAHGCGVSLIEWTSLWKSVSAGPTLFCYYNVNDPQRSRGKGVKGCESPSVLR